VKLESVRKIARVLNRAKVKFIIVGGLAVAAHGYGRQTQDVDLVIQLIPDSIQGAFRALAKLGYRPIVPVTADAFSDPRQRSKWIKEKGMMVLHFHSDLQPDTSVDLFAKEPFDFASEYKRSKTEKVGGGVDVRIVRLETLLRLKRKAGRPQDLTDIAELRMISRRKSRA